MQNRFLEMNDHLRRAAGAKVRNSYPRTGNASSPNHGTFNGPVSSQFSVWEHSLAAQDRTLVLLIENGGVTLGIPTLVEKLLSSIPGASVIPASYREKLGNFLGEQIKILTDGAIESVELYANRYSAAKPDLFGDVVILRDGTSSYQDLKGKLLSLSREGKLIDLLILTHGSDDSISVPGGINSQKIRDMRTENGKPLSIRSVYMMNCVGSSLNQAWLDAGAKVAAGALRNNYLPEPTTYFFWQNWKEGQSFENAVTAAYRKTFNMMNDAVRGFLRALPIPGAGSLADLIDFENMDFVKDSAPVIQGQRSVTINTDDLSFEQSIPTASSLATTVLPVSLLRSLGLARSTSDEQTAVRTISQAGIDFIKGWEGFRATMYNDAAGHCTIGYGTLLHNGNCDGRPVEQPYVNGISAEQATELLMTKARAFQHVINDKVTVALNQNQNDALVSFVYNIGAANFQKSTCLRLLNQGNYNAVPAEIRKWTKARQNGVLVDLPGLVNRRNAEAELFQRVVPATAQSVRSYVTQQSRYVRAMSPGDIPLDPGAGGQSISESALDVGDIIVSTTNQRVSRLIRWATTSTVSHSMLYIGDGQVVEAIGDGVTLRSLAEALNDATVAVAFRHPTLTATQALMVRDFAGQQLGKSYNYWGIVQQGGFQLDRRVYCSGRSGADYDACINWVGRINLGKGSDDSFFCSQLVIAAYQSAGVPLTSTPPHWSSPDDLAQLGMSSRLGYVGHLKAFVTAQSFSAPNKRPGMAARTTITQTLAMPLSFSAAEWETLISFRPPTAIQSAVNAKGVNWHVHRLEDANGDINLDYYPVTITRLPSISGRTVTADELLSHIRLNFNSFVDTNVSEFAPYDGSEAGVWQSPAPLGSVVHIDMKSAEGWLNLDDGSVVVAEFAPDHWIFATIWTVLDAAHPVSGNRKFGVATDESGNMLFYTRGADRATGLLDVAAMSVVFASAHNLWLSLQQGVANFVNSNGGAASIGTATSIRTPWPTVQSSYHHPTVSWI
jgi:GH24 family phage-related lysozyme (muramidase)/uncharacterized protein YycO